MSPDHSSLFVRGQPRRALLRNLGGLVLLLVMAGTASATGYRNITLAEPPWEELEFWQHPSMNQAADLALLGYQGWASLSDYWRDTRFRNDEFSPLVLDAGMWVFVLPHPAIWARNAWQQDLLRSEGLDSESQAYYLWSDLVEREAYVTGPDNDELAAMRDSAPGQFTRLGSVRYEASHAMVGELTEGSFFHDERPRYRLPKAYLVLSDIYSLHRCRSEDYDLPADAPENEQDIIGFDCRHWVYELHNAATDSADRPGRTIAHADLSEEEQDYLDSAFYFSFLNLIDAHFVDERNGLDSFRFSFQPTPFGRAFGYHQLSVAEHYQLGFDLYWQQNRERNLPGGRFSLIELPVGNGALTTRAAVWQQPEALSFRTEETSTGWAVEASYSHPVPGGLRLQADWHHKSEGWYPGYASLSEGSGWRLGVDLPLY